jgi:hypothetical protein
MPKSLKAKVSCRQCGEQLVFRDKSQSADEVWWLSIGGRKGPAKLAVPVPIGLQLRIGRSPQCWLAMPGDHIADQQAELQLHEDGKLTIQHLGDSAGTWINKAKILSGVLHEGDRMFVGPYVLRVRRQAALTLAADAEDVPRVIVEDEDVEPAGPQRADKGQGHEVGAGKRLDGAILDESRGIRFPIKAVLSIVGIVASGGFLARAIIWRPVSEDMPADTEYTCPVDGTVVRASWDAGPPQCPSCGTLCFGAMTYKAEPDPRAPATQPTSQPASRPEEEAPPKEVKDAQAMDEPGEMP